MPRAGFLPAQRSAGRAAYDGPLPIGHGQTNSQPRTVAAMLRLLEVRPGQRVLDVGAGSGWTTALLAHLTGPAGGCSGSSSSPTWCEFGRANLARTDQPWARIEQAEPGVLGLPDDAPYDRVLVSAEARQLPQELVDQLAHPGGWSSRWRAMLLLVVRDGAGRSRSSPSTGATGSCRCAERSTVPACARRPRRVRSKLTSTVSKPLCRWARA